MGDISPQFQEYVENVFNSEIRGFEAGERVWGKTPKGRHFVIITTYVSFF